MREGTQVVSKQDKYSQPTQEHLSEMMKTKKEAFKPVLGGGNLKRTNIKTRSQLFNRKDRSLKKSGEHF